MGKNVKAPRKKESRRSALKKVSELNVDTKNEQTAYGKHDPVLFRECVDLILSPEALDKISQHVINTQNSHSKKFIIVDCTLGGGGHSFALLKKYPQCLIVSFDQDPEAIKNTRESERYIAHKDRWILVPKNFEFIGQEVSRLFPNPEEFEIVGLMADLGISSHQIDTAERGFSWRFDALLNMKMSDDKGQKSAYDIVNESSEDDLLYILKEYGEEQLTKKIVQRIIEQRKISPIKTTLELENIIFHSYPEKWRHGRTHPATKTFQALRIAVNDELGVLERLIDQLGLILSQNARALIISFHSLEDRIVKHKFRDMNESGAFRLLTKKPVYPTSEEIELNSRSRSAKLRIIEKL